MRTDEETVELHLSEELRLEIVGALRLRRWTREEYDRMVDAEVLTTNDKVELIEGEIVERAPKTPPRATTITLAGRMLERFINESQHVRNQGPLALSNDSEPEPALALVHDSPRDYGDAHPATALLVVEASESTLSFDRTTKARVYARAGIPEYWIINVQARCVEVHRDPVRGAPPQKEPRYMTLTVYKPGESITPLAMPQQAVAVADLVR